MQFLNFEDMSIATEVFMYMLENKTLTSDDNRFLFDEYNKENIQTIMDAFAKKANVKIKLINNTIYLLPNEDNKFLGFNKTELKNTMLGSNNSEQEYYLANFIILVLLTSFYNSTSGLKKSRNYIRYNDFENMINTKLTEASNHLEKDTLIEETGLAFENIVSKWFSLKGSDTKVPSKTTRRGFVLTVLKFLGNQDLITYISKEEKIMTTTKLDDLVDVLILNKANFKSIEENFKKLRKDILEEEGR